jgi:hypothetical protein
MVTVAAGVWDRWRELERESAEPAIVLLFTSDLTNRDALLALREAAGSAIESLEQERTSRGEGEEPRTGHWSLASVPEGVALRIDEEPDSFEGLLERIIHGLDAQGVAGRFDLYEPAEAVELPEKLDLLECRMRVNGTRIHKRFNKYRWQPDWTALWETAEVGINWCTPGSLHLPLSLKVSLISSATLTPTDDVASYVRDGLEQTRDLGVVLLTSGSPHRFRTLAVCASRGRVSFIEGGDLAARTWATSLQSLRNLMVATSERLVYGFIKRGESRWAAEEATSQIQDWPRIPHFNAWSITAEAFEDEFVPDAFGVQMLGPGYAGRVPVGPNWRSVPAGRDRVVLEHVDPAAWFEAPLVSGATYGFPAPADAPIPDLLVRARREFTGILFNDEIPANIDT